MMRRAAYDSEEIRDALTVADVLEFAGIPVDGDRIACPIHDGEDVTAFAIYDEGRRYWCHTECGKGGDVFTLIMALAEKRSRKVGFREALEIAAHLAKIEPGPPPGPAAIAARKAERERRKAERAASLALKHDESIRRATETWLDLMRPWWHDGRRRRLCGEYLASRGLGPLADTDHPFAGSVSRILHARDDGSPTIPIFSCQQIDDPLFPNPVVNIAWRQVRPNAEPKVLVLPNCTTKGTFGEVWRSSGDSAEQIVLCEGVMDWLTALAVFESDYLTPIAPLVRGHHIVIGAHSVGILPWIVSTLADDPKIGSKFRKLPLLLVTHNDGPGGAGERFEAKVIAEATARGMGVSRFDLAGEADLNDWFRAQCGMKAVA